MPTRIEEITKSRQKERDKSPEVVQTKNLSYIADELAVIREQIEILTRAITNYLATK